MCKPRWAWHNEKLPSFVAQRKRNFARLYEGLKQFEKFFDSADVVARCRRVSWFACPLTLRDGVPFDRRAITTYLENRKIETRTLFAGNILKQPGYRNIESRVIGNLPVANKVMTAHFLWACIRGWTKRR